MRGVSDILSSRELGLRGIRGSASHLCLLVSKNLLLYVSVFGSQNKGFSLNKGKKKVHTHPLVSDKQGGTS
jgi:hypothetical protein